MFVDKNSAERVKLVIDHILKLQNYIQSLEALQIDSEEFAYLKALVLFSPGKWITGESLNQATHENWGNTKFKWFFAVFTLKICLWVLLVNYFKKISHW